MLHALSSVCFVLGENPKPEICKYHFIFRTIRALIDYLSKTLHHKNNNSFFVSA